MPETFTPKTWVDGSAGGTPIIATELNRIEVGIESMDDRVAALELRDTSNALGYGVDPTGANTTGALQALFDTAGVTVPYLPPGLYGITATLTLPAGKSLVLSPGATLKAISTITGPMVETPVGTRSDDQVITGGVFDCNNNADNGIYIRYFAHFTVANVRINAPKSHALIMHDTAAAVTSYEAVVTDVHTTRPSAAAVPANTYGLWLRSGDSYVTRVVAQGNDIGIRVETESNSFSQCHAWGYNGHVPTTCFYDNSYNNTWIGCDADTPATYGWYLSGKYTNFFGCRVFNNGYGSDNVITGVFANDAAPAINVQGFRFVGVDASHRIALDVSANAPSGSVFHGVLNQENVVARNIPFAEQVVTQRVTGALTVHSVNATRAIAVRNAAGTSTYFAVDPTTTQRRVLVGNGAYVSGYSDELATETLRLDTALGAVRPGSTAGLGAAIYSGTSAPALAAAVGDLYVRSDAGPIDNIYRCITAATATTAAWSRVVTSGYDFPYTVDPGLIRNSDAVPLPAANGALYQRVLGGGSITQIGVYVVVASGNISVATYSNSGSGRNAVPGARSATSGAVACPAIGFALVSLGATVTVAPGDWIGLSADNLTATFRSLLATPGDNALGAGRQYRQATAHPLPATPSSLTATVGYTIPLVGG